MKDVKGARDHVDLAKYVSQAFDASLTWDDLAWVRDRWDSPLIVKGVLRGDDAAQAVRIGATGIVVSNHGGRQLDHAVSSITTVPEIVQAVGSDAEVYLDGGVRRGTDILKAMALGARACFTGRPFIYGIGADGERGARRAMSIYVNELRTAMMLSGHPTIDAIELGSVRLPTADVEPTRPEPLSLAMHG